MSNYSEFTYTVKRDTTQNKNNPNRVGHFIVYKWGDGDAPQEQYDVYIPLANSTQGLYCNCLGFSRQTYPKEQHKHIKLVRLFLKENEPTGRVYKLVGNDPVVANQSLFTDKGPLPLLNIKDDPKEFDPSD